jgi:coiled-coil family 90 protein
MNAVPFDTLKMAQRLEAAGFSAPQAAGASEALAEAIVGSGLATKDDLAREIASVRAEIGAVRSEIGSLRNEFMRELAATKAALSADIELLRRDMTIKLGGMLIIAVGVLLAAMRYMPHL